MEQCEIDARQQEWILGYVPRGKTLHVGCGEKPIRLTGVLNVDADPSVHQRGFADMCLDAHGLAPLETGAFDCVVSNHVLPALRDPVGALREMARVLRPGGIMAHVVPDWRYAPQRKDERFVFGYQHNGWYGPDDFVQVTDYLVDCLETLELVEFLEFQWAFKYVAVRL